MKKNQELLNGLLRDPSYTNRMPASARSPKTRKGVATKTINLAFKDAFTTAFKIE